MCWLDNQHYVLACCTYYLLGRQHQLRGDPPYGQQAPPATHQRQQQSDQKKTRESLRDSFNTWTSSKVNFDMGLSLGMKQNKNPLHWDRMRLP